MDLLSRYTAAAHYATVMFGLVLMSGLFLTDLLGIRSEILDMLGILFGFLFAFSLIASVPMAVLSLLFCGRDMALVIEGILLLTVAALVWLYEEASLATEYVITGVFILYSIAVIYFWWRGNKRV
jgi:hypothetical protein